MPDTLPPSPPTPPPLLMKPPLPAPGQVAALSLTFAGSWQTLLPLIAKTVALNVLTFGIYRFWGRTELRRYLWQHVQIGADRLAYSGTPKELWRGFTKLVALTLGLMAASYSVRQISPTFDSLASSAFVLLLLPWSIYGARQYLLSRTSFRAIRLGMKPKQWAHYMWLDFKATVLSFVTLGLYYPVKVHTTHAFLVSQTVWGSRSLTYSGQAYAMRRLYGASWLWLFLTLGLYYPWHSAKLKRYRAGHTHLDAVTFQLEVTGAQLAKLWAGNTLGIVLTLGLALPWASARSFIFYVTHLRLVGRLDGASIAALEADTGAAVADTWAGDVFGAGLDL